jgi:ribose-phosphate pyrophosphokinase
MIVAGSQSQALAAALAAATEHELAPVTYETFPDGEGRASVDPVAADPTEAVVVAATTTDAAHVEAHQLQDAVHELGAETVTTVLPYMGYARQDAVFERGQPLTARAVARALSTGTDRVLVVTPHEDDVCDFFAVPATAVDAAPRLAAPLPDDLADPLFLAPDEGAVEQASAVRDAYGRGAVDAFSKTRHDGDAVTVDPGDASASGRDVVLTDDIVATGSTMSEAIGVLGERGAERVYVACVHPVLAGDARLKLARAGVERVVGTDTVERSVSAVSAAPAVADHL